MLLVGELLRETGSHTHADLTGLDLAASQAELATILHAEWFANVNRDPQKGSPLELPRPWIKRKPNADVTPAQRVDLERRLEARSVFRDR